MVMGSLSPGVYLLIYVGVILTFTVLYSIIAEQFYHPYAKYEVALGEEVNKIRMGVTQALKRTVAKNNQLVGNVKMIPDSIRVMSIQPEGRWLQFIMEIMIDSGHAGTLLNVPLQLSPISALAIINPEGGRETFMFAQVYSKITLPVPIAFTQNFGDFETIQRNLEMTVERIQVTNQDVTRISSFLYAFAGFPHAVPGVFGRMLYFSIVTVTTVGYGDIVPLSTLARALVGIEATFGIILLGLFISSLSRDSKSAP
jgi:hypothetical protein